MLKPSNCMIDCIGVFGQVLISKNTPAPSRLTTLVRVAQPVAVIALCPMSIIV
jgi:hypothetical protein